MVKVIGINPGDATWTKHRFVLWFGACGGAKLFVNANSLEDALDECVDWIADNAPGLLCDDTVNEAYNEAISAGKSEEEARDEAEADTTCAGNNGHYLLSWEWGLVCEDPSFAELRALVAA